MCRYPDKPWRQQHCRSSLYGWLVILFVLLALANPLVAQTLSTNSASPSFILVDKSPDSLRELRKSVEQGDANAQFELARRLFLGIGLSPDVATAESLFEKAAETGHPEAQLKMGVICERGIARPVDYEQALQWYRRSAGQGNALAQFKLGYIYGINSDLVTRKTGPNSTFTGSAVPSDPVQAKEWFARAAAQGYPPAFLYAAQSSLGPNGMPQMLPPGARDYMREAALMGVPEAISAILMRSMMQAATNPDWPDTYRWASLAERENGGKGPVKLQLLEGRMTSEQIAAGKKLVAETRFPAPRPEFFRSQELVYLFNPGSPVLTTNTAIFESISKSAVQGDVGAQFTLALCFLHDSYRPQENFNTLGTSLVRAPGVGERVATSMAVQPGARQVQAVQWFTSAADQGHRDAQYHLAWLHLNGRGTAEDKLQAKKYFELAAQQGHIAAKYQLALLMEEGVGGPKVMTEVVRLLREAADAGHADAAKALARLLPGSGMAQTATISDGAKPTNNRKPRVAVLSLADHLLASADLLVASLSANHSVEVVDRQEIEKVLKEQALSAVKSTDLVKLGQLLRADGFLLLSPRTEAEKAVMEARLLVTGPGVAVGRWVYPLPMADPVGWSDLLARLVVSYAPKLVVLPQDAIPLSVLNLRSSISSRETETRERELTYLLLNRLQRTPEVFVLERQQLNRLSEEKELVGGSSEPFWNGSYLLDGVINRDGEEAGKLTIHARLISRQHQTNELMVTGASADLPAIIDQLAAKMSPLLGKATSPARWNYAEEAAYYYEEARWAMRWKMYAEAQQAGDASWALGLRLFELIQLRISAYENAAATSTGTRTFSQTATMKSTPLNNDSEWDVKIKVENRPAPATLDALIHAQQLYLNMGTPSYIQSLGTNQAAWYALGVDVQKRSAQVLEHYYLSSADRGVVNAKLISARQQSRELADLLLKSAETMPESTRIRFYECLIAYGALWEDESPGMRTALESYLTHGVMRQFLESLYRTDKLEGRWYDWAGTARNTASLLEGTLQAQPLDRQLELCALAAIRSNGQKEVEQWVTRLADICLAHEEAFIHGELSGHPWQYANALRYNSRFNYGLPPSIQVPADGSNLSDKFAKMKKAVSQRDAYAKEKATTDKAKAVEQTFLALKAILQNGQEVPFFEQNKYRLPSYTPEQIAELEALLPEYEKHFKEQNFFAVSLRTRLRSLKQAKPVVIQVPQ